MSRDLAQGTPRFAKGRTLRCATIASAFLGVLGASSYFAGCAATHAPPPRQTCGDEPSQVLACVRAREDAVTSLRARFTSTMRRDGESHATTGVLLVSKPERFRLRLMLPFGLTVFDCVKDGEEVRTTLPLQGGSDPASLPLPQIDLEEAFLRGAYAFPGNCEASPGSEGLALVRCDGSGGRRRELRLDAETATIVDETSDEAGEPRMVLRYGDYRLVPGTAVVMPYRIRLEQPARRIALDIAIERYELNPTLSPALFRPAS